MANDLVNFIKYCLGYVKLTRERTVASQQKHSVNLLQKYFSLVGLLNGETDGSLAELINLEVFYKYDPKNVPDALKIQYEKEKELANKVEEIYNKHRNDQFTKQIVLNFGYFEIEIPTIDEAIDEEVDVADEGQQVVSEPTIDRYPLFGLPVRIEKEISKTGTGKYFIYSVDTEIQINIGILESILGQDLYFQILTELGRYEVEGKLTLPIVDLEIFREIWRKIKAQLKLKDAKFDEESFSLDEIKIALSPRANYFLAEDLAKLSQLPEDDLCKTALTSWTQDNDLGDVSDVPSEKDLYFPFPYDKYQLATLSILGNKAAIIQGPPGTGKSETISNILCHLAATGKRVLFVSQKAQALKVVKDKLKKLDVKYLFGYLPNPSSMQLGEDDESDGIAPQLGGLGAYIEKISQMIGGSLLISSVHAASREEDQRETHRKTFSEAVLAQREYYKLHQELLQLKDYDVSLHNFDLFEQSFSYSTWLEIKNTIAEVFALNKELDDYRDNVDGAEFDKLFLELDLKNQHYSEVVQAIKSDVALTGYDRHWKFFRKINNTRRQLRLGDVRKGLPREVLDYIDKVLGFDISRNEALILLESLRCYFCNHENLKRLDNSKLKLNATETACGVNHEEFLLVDQKITSSSPEDVEEVKRRILRVHEIKSALQQLKQSEDANTAKTKLRDAEVKNNKGISRYIQNIVNRNIAKKWGVLLVRQVTQKLSRAFGKSKKAFKTFDKLRSDENNFKVALDLIPIWIMELDDASRIVPLEAALFDYVILDEASQCNVAYTLPVMFRAKRALFVGDSEQMRDSTVMFKSNRAFDDLAHRYGVPDDRQIKATGAAVQSVLDIAKNRGFMYRTLHYHYRSPMELIGFSNKYFYKPNGKELIPLNSNYLTYKDTNRVMLIHDVKSDWSEEISDNVNVAEAKAILELFRELRSDERYHDKSVGILSFFNAQATYIRELFEREGYKEEDDNYKVSIIEGIQGDEKDIVIYSFVIRKPEQKNRYYPLTGEGGDIRADVNKGRVNVAFSRARLQVHCFVSMPIQEIPEKIWLKKYLEYVQDNGEVLFHSEDLKPFDSYFEEEFYNHLRVALKNGYKIQNQIESCGFKIDFVVSNAKTGQRIAIECDGPTHFKDEIDEAYGIYVQSDEERQRVLEAAGWTFYRVKYIDWIDDKFNRDDVVKVVESMLKPQNSDATAFLTPRRVGWMKELQNSEQEVDGEQDKQEVDEDLRSALIACAVNKFGESALNSEDGIVRDEHLNVLLEKMPKDKSSYAKHVPFSIRLYTNDKQKSCIDDLLEIIKRRKWL